METNYKLILQYDKSNNLVHFLELNNFNKIKCYYHVDGSCLDRKFLNEYHDEDLHSEIISSVICYENNIMLFPIYINGETSVRVILSGDSFTSFKSPNILSKIDVYETSEINQVSIQNFTIKSNLIDEWINKL